MARIEDGYRLELAGLKDVGDWEAEARKLFGLSETADADFISAYNVKAGGYRCVASVDGEVIGALFATRQPVQAARSWLCEQFFEKTASPLALLAGGPARSCKDPGRKICVCFNVGVNTIGDAIAEHGLIDADGVGRATGAGTGCGSCKPEIDALLRNHAPKAEMANA
jgi:assimilatory nitrate reductase catalytic subunit